MDKNYTVKEMAELLNESKWVLYGWIKDHGLPVHRVGSAIRLRKSEVTAFLKRQEFLSGVN